MPSRNCFKPVHITPVTGLLDLRSTADATPFGGYRYLKNFEVRARNKMCRAYGFTRLMAEQGQNNADLHDQLLDKAVARPDEPFFGIWQPIQKLHRATTAVGFHKLFAATQNRIYAINTSTLNWKIISDTLGGEAQDGCTDLNWSIANLFNTVIFTNNVDAPMYHSIDQPSDAAGQSVAPIDDLVTLNVTKVGMAFTWKNFMFLADVEQDGQRFTNRLIWSDFKRPLSYLQNPGISLAGTVDFASGEVILNAEALGNFLLIYTNFSIWEVTAVGLPEIFSFRKRFTTDPTGSRCLAYRNTLVSTGNAHYYLGRDGVYSYNLYVGEPVLVEWMHRASTAIFDELDTAKCNVHCAGYQPLTKTIHFSWVPEGSSCPEQSLAFNTEFQFSSLLDYGVTAYCNFGGQVLTSVRDFLLDRCICTSQEISDAGGSEQEGGYCVEPETTICTIEKTPTSIYTSEPIELEDGIITEDWTRPSPDSDSLCALLDDATMQELCADESVLEECSPNQAFVFALAEDRCLKQIAKVYYREICTGVTSCGTYLLRGYRSLARSGPLGLGKPEDDKIISEFSAEIYAEAQTVPSQVAVRIGSAGQALDPNTASGRCVIAWEEQDPIPLECQSDETAAQHEEDNTRPDIGFQWPLYYTGIFLYYEIEIVNPAANPPDTGGGCCISRFSFDVAANPKCY